MFAVFIIQVLHFLWKLFLNALFLDVIEIWIISFIDCPLLLYTTTIGSFLLLLYPEYLLNFLLVQDHVSSNKYGFTFFFKNLDSFNVFPSPKSPLLKISSTKLNRSGKNKIVCSDLGVGQSVFHNEVRFSCWFFHRYPLKVEKIPSFLYGHYFIIKAYKTVFILVISHT